MAEINTVPEVVAYLKQRWGELQREHKGYDDEHPDGSEDVEDSTTEGYMDGAETEVSRLLAVLGVDAHKLTARLNDEYGDGACPDCGDDIPDDAVSGDACGNCGHVFTATPMA